VVLVSLERFMELFAGRDGVFAEQQADGSYLPVRRPITRQDYIAHGCGDHTYGIYTVNSDNQTRFIVFDLDTMDAEPRSRLVHALNELRIYESQRLLEFSGRKGFHIWLPFGGWLPASLAYRAGRAVLQRAGVDCEVFPKQSDVGNGYGNLIKLPKGVHRVTGERSCFYPFDAWKHVQPINSTQLIRLAEAYTEPTRPEPGPIRAGNLSSYARAALTNECAKVAEAEDGDRNNQLNRSAYSLFGLVASGVLDYEDVRDNLINAAETAGLTSAETIKTLTSACRAGMARPLEVAS